MPLKTVLSGRAVTQRIKVTLGDNKLIFPKSSHRREGRGPKHATENGAEWKGRRSTDKSYSRDNMLIFPKSSHRREGLAPRCRLFATWGNNFYLYF
ncbi:hypothetical protein R6Q59_005194 [Mikania micrantha]